MARETAADRGHNLEDLEEEGDFRFACVGPEYYQVYHGETGEHLGLVYRDGSDWVSEEPHDCFDSRLGAAAYLLAFASRR